MVRYMVLLPADEAEWAKASADERGSTYARHVEFMDRLTAEGHRLVAGEELGPSAEAITVTGSVDAPVVTDGPYAETVEQLSGFYLVDTDDRDGLARLAALIGPAEIRRCVADSDPNGPTGGK